MSRYDPYGTFPTTNAYIPTNTPGAHYVMAPPVVVVQQDPETRRREIEAENDRLFLASLTPEQREAELKRRYTCAITVFVVFIFFAVLMFFLFNRHSSRF